MYKLAQHGYFLTNVNAHLKRSVPYRAVPYRAGATSVNALLQYIETYIGTSALSLIHVAKPLTI